MSRLGQLTVVASASAMFIASGLAASAQAFSVSDAEPEWLVDYLQYFTTGSGCWIADNAAYRTDTEPFAEYRVFWTQGVSELDKLGKLYGVTDDQSLEHFWDIRVFWDGAQSRVGVLQIGRFGQVGHGSLDVSSELTSVEQVLEFALPDGRSWQDQHQMSLQADSHTTISFIWDGSTWGSNRTYLWRRCGGSHHQDG